MALDESFDRALLFIEERDIIVFEKECYAMPIGTESVIRSISPKDGRLIFDCHTRMVQRYDSGRRLHVIGTAYVDGQIAEWLRDDIIKIHKRQMSECESCYKRLSYSPTIGGFCIDCDEEKTSEWLCGSSSDTLRRWREKRDKL
jgi:hypothetical protein